MERTIVSELKITSANIRTRSLLSRAAASFGLSEDDQFRQIEQNIGPDSSIFIPSVEKFIYIVADHFSLDIVVDSNTNFILEQKGMYVNTGPLPQGLVISSDKQTHCVCIYV